MEFYPKYTILAESDEPIMLINKHIGDDKDLGPGIIGHEFSRELMILDSMGKKLIKIWVNTVGGSVMDGMDIYHAILKCKTPIETCCHGVAASMGAVIFQAGKRRVMMDYAKLMFHGTSGGSSELTGEFNEMVAIMIAAKSGKTKEDVMKMFGRDTWINSKECRELGYCDERENSGLKVVNEANEPISMQRQFAAIMNKAISDSIPNTMKKVTGRLQLAEGSNEEVIDAAIAGIQNKLTDTTASLETEKKTSGLLAQEVADLKNKLQDLEKVQNAAKAEAEESAKKDKQTKAETLVKGAVEAGQITNEDTVVASWTAKAVEDFDGIKAMLDALPINKTKPAEVKNFKPESGVTKKWTAGLVMAEINNKLEKQNQL